MNKTSRQLENPIYVPHQGRCPTAAPSPQLCPAPHPIPPSTRLLNEGEAVKPQRWLLVSFFL